MLTKSDLKAIKQIIQETSATKDDFHVLKDDFNILKNDSNTVKDDAKNFVTKGDLDTLVSKNVFDQFKDKVLTLLDKVIGELKAIREEQTILSGNKDQIENHETRISKLEEVLEPNPVSL